MRTRMEQHAPGDVIRVPYWLRGYSCLWRHMGQACSFCGVCAVWNRSSGPLYSGDMTRLPAQEKVA
jgi:hypothetical protein